MCFPWTLYRDKQATKSYTLRCSCRSLIGTIKTILKWNKARGGTNAKREERVLSVLMLNLVNQACMALCPQQRWGGSCPMQCRRGYLVAHPTPRLFVLEPATPTD